MTKSCPPVGADTLSEKCAQTHVEEVVTGHAGLAGHASRDEDDLGALEGLLEAVVLRAVADGLCALRSVDFFPRRDLCASQDGLERCESGPAFVALEPDPAGSGRWHADRSGR